MKSVSLTSAALAAVLTAAAFPALAETGLTGRMGDNLASYDANKDGMIHREEVRAGRAGQFEKLDRNHDGVISDADIPGVMKRAKSAQFQMFIQTFDVNDDNRVIRDEFVSGPMPAFDQADLNKNGVVDTAELKAFRRKG